MRFTSLNIDIYGRQIFEVVVLIKLLCTQCSFLLGMFTTSHERQYTYVLRGDGIRFTRNYKQLFVFLQYVYINF